MNSTTLETYLARLYTDATARESFLANPETAARNASLSDADVMALAGIDMAGLRMAATSYANKRAQHRRSRQTLYDALAGWWAKRRIMSRKN